MSTIKQILTCLFVGAVLGGCDTEEGTGFVLLIPTDDSGVAMSDLGGEAPPDSMNVPPEPILVPEFGRASERKFEVFAQRSDGLSHPRDLEFDPDASANLWVVDRDWDGNVILFEAGQPSQRIERMRDMAASHFMEEVASVAFSDRGSFATCQESRNSMDGFAFPNDFMGPALWSTDLMIHCNVNQVEGGPLNGSHLDMLHQSPLCMGITHQVGHAFFVTDGANGHVVRYDFREPHVPGGDDHSDGQVSRYPELTFTRVPDVPGHLSIDGDLLYYADTGGGQIRVADLTTGRVSGTLIPDNEPLALFNRYSDVEVRTFASELGAPSGLVVSKDRVFVSLPLTGEILAFTKEGQEIERINTGSPGVMGLELSPDGYLWYVNAYEGTVNRVNPNGGAMVPDQGDQQVLSRGDCVYPAWSISPGFGKVLPPYSWSSVVNAGSGASTLDSLDIFCGSDWAGVETIFFVVITEWIPWLFDYVSWVDALAPQIEESGGRIVFVGAQDARGRLLRGAETDALIRDFTPNRSGLRVGEADNQWEQFAINTALVDHLPSTFVVRRRDMRVIATQRTRGVEHLPLVEIARDPEADWSDPGPPTIVPVIPSNCEDGDDEIYEPNDTPDDAAIIGEGRFMGGVCNRNGDFFYVDLPGRWSLELNFSHAVGDLDVILFVNGQPAVGQRGMPIGSNSSTDDEFFEWRDPAMVYVYGYDGATAPYRLIVRQP